ncbi:hypothetical protein Fmac_024705 [Flemingia macrophylla]|uniref:Uncharacterized protein n=1 Tax=Flemingia macrophylla TaxID=520843 RepID=A0ABD1LQ50_9FABA
MTQEEKFMDEEVFLDETLLSTNEKSLATRLSKWTRPPLHADYVSQSRSVVSQFLIFAFPLPLSHNDMVPNSSPLMHRISFPFLLLPLPHLEFNLLATVILPVDVAEPIGVRWTSQHHALPVVDNVGVIRKILDCLGRRDADIVEQIVYYTSDKVARGLALQQLNIYDAADCYVEPAASAPHPGQAIDISPLLMPRSSREAIGPRTRRRVEPMHHIVLPVHERLLEHNYGSTEDTDVYPSQYQEAVHHDYPPAQLYFHPTLEYHVSPHHVPAHDV